MENTNRRRVWVSHPAFHSGCTAWQPRIFAYKTPLHLPILVCAGGRHSFPPLFVKVAAISSEHAVVPRPAPPRRSGGGEAASSNRSSVLGYGFDCNPLSHEVNMGAGGAVTASPASLLPHALEAIDQIESDSKTLQKQIVFFLDYDGTLSPIVDKPDEAKLPAETRAVLSRLKTHYPVAVITGRSLAKVKSFIQLDGLMYAGSHGFDIEAPSFGTHCVAAEHLPSLQASREALTPVVAQVPGASLEDNRFSLSIHYRLVDQTAAVEALLKKVKETVEKNGQRLHHGKMVWEIRPQFDWDKGKAVQYLLRQSHMDTDKYLPIFVGDDMTDEDAFRALRACNGLGVIVHDGQKPVNGHKPRETLAEMRLENPTEVRTFLERFLCSKQTEAAGAATTGRVLDDE